MAESKSAFLNPDKNRLLGGAMRILFYNQFCAGRNNTEVKQTVDMMKGMGFKGVILGYAKDVVVDPATTQGQVAESGQKIPSAAAIEIWREGNLQTLPMIGSGDFLAIK
jgi:proline dehydrogenase